MESVLSKAVSRLGRKKVWLVVRAARALGEQQRTAADVRESLRRINVYIDDAEFATIANVYAPDGALFDTDAFVRDFLALLSSRRRYAVDLVLRAVDPEGTGFIPFGILENSYDAMRHPHTLVRREPEELVAEFIACFDEARDAGGITSEELVAFYLGVSTGMPRDEDFELRCIRSFSLDRPKAKFDVEEEVSSKASVSARRALGRASHHPLYTVTSADYGKDVHKMNYNGRFARSHCFTKNAVAQHAAGATSMNM